MSELERLQDALAASLIGGPDAPIETDRWLSKLDEIEQLKAALKPFADFADARRAVPAEMAITSGSGMAKRQLTMGDCYEAARLLQQR